MKEISLLDIIYTAAMLFAIFYGAVVITSFFSDRRKENEMKENEEES